ncbi:MAG: hypothetical protein AAFO87_04190 [Cyanobacteria bacterium J06607_6]
MSSLPGLIFRRWQSDRRGASETGRRAANSVKLPPAERCLWAS